VQAMHPYYIIRALGGALYLTGALIMVYNLWRTVGDRTPALADASARPALTLVPEPALAARAVS